MNRNKNIYLFVLLVIYNFFFWKETFGVNLVIFCFISLTMLMILRRHIIEDKVLILLLFICVYAAFCVIWINSVYSNLMFISCIILVTGFIHQEQLKTLPAAFLTTFSSFTIFPYNFIEELRIAKNKYRPVAYFLKASKIVILPVIVFLVFYAIYAYSNPIFNSYSVSFWDKVRENLNVVLEYYPPERFIYIFFGLFLIMGILYRRNVWIFLKIEHLFIDSLFRDKYKKLFHGSLELSGFFRKTLPQFFKFKMYSLRNEYKAGVVLIFLVNFLILILNIIDIKFVWFGFDVREVDNLAYFVHEGTYYLIFSIILSMLILLYYFRGNLNFYKKNRLLRLGAYLWIFQNGILSVSLALRNYYYISYYYALSFKRIGVMIFIVLVFIGLISMMIKIKYKKTLFYLIKINSWALLIVFLIVSSFDWDYQIAKFNLKNPNKSAIDYSYLFFLSDNVLPVLNGKRDELGKVNIFYEGEMRGPINAIVFLDNKIDNFVINYEGKTWLSWNYNDYKTYSLIKK